MGRDLCAVRRVDTALCIPKLGGQRLEARCTPVGLSAGLSDNGNMETKSSPFNPFVRFWKYALSTRSSPVPGLRPQQGPCPHRGGFWVLRGQFEKTKNWWEAPSTPKLGCPQAIHFLPVSHPAQPSTFCNDLLFYLFT